MRIPERRVINLNGQSYEKDSSCIGEGHFIFDCVCLRVCVFKSKDKQRIERGLMFSKKKQVIFKPLKATSVFKMSRSPLRIELRKPFPLGLWVESVDDGGQQTPFNNIHIGVSSNTSTIGASIVSSLTRGNNGLCRVGLRHHIKEKRPNPNTTYLMNGS